MEVLMFLNHIADLADQGLTKTVGTASTVQLTPMKPPPRGHTVESQGVE